MNGMDQWLLYRYSATATLFSLVFVFELPFLCTLITTLFLKIIGVAEIYT